MKLSKKSTAFRGTRNTGNVETPATRPSLRRQRSACANALAKPSLTLWHFLVFFVTVLLLLFFAAPAAAQPQICHLLVFADMSDPQLRKGVEIDAAGIRSAFSSNIPSKRLRTEEWKDESFSAQEMLRAIRERPLRRGVDTLVVYYAGHGAYDSRLGHYVKPLGTPLLRSDIRRAMESTGARLNILITDSCSVLMQRDRPADGWAAKAAPGAGRTMAPPAFRTLFWVPSGFVDICSSSPGEVAVADNLEGGYFTKSLCSFLQRESQRELSWNEVLSEMKLAVSSRFREHHPSGLNVMTRGIPRNVRTQTVHGQLALSGTAGRTVTGRQPIPPRGPRFGVGVEFVDGRVRIAKVLPDSPATRVIFNATGTTGYLDPGDVILEINGKRITSIEGFSAAIDRSERRMSLVILNVRTGQRLPMTVNLAY